MKYKVDLVQNVWYILDEYGYLIAYGTKRYVEDFLDWAENHERRRAVAG